MQLNFRRIGAVFVGATVFAAVNALIFVFIEEFLDDQVRWVINRILRGHFRGLASFESFLRWLLVSLMLMSPSLLACLTAHLVFERCAVLYHVRTENRSSRKIILYLAGFWISMTAVTMSSLTSMGVNSLDTIAECIAFLLPVVLGKWARFIAFVLIATLLFAFWLTVYALWTAKPSADAEPRCRKCGCILRGLADNRCAECFTPFESTRTNGMRDAPCD